MNPLKKIWNWYIKGFKDSVEPEEYSHVVTMDITIPKGEKKGRALIPCAIYAMDHSIDLNPSLIRKKTGKVVKTYDVGERIEFDSNEYEVKLTPEEEAAGVELEELERCEHCGQKVVISEVAQTRYRSCPDIWVTVGDPAKEELHVPVTFGFNRSDVFWVPAGAAIITTASAIFTAGIMGIPIGAWFEKAVNFTFGWLPSVTVSDHTAMIIAYSMLGFLALMMWLFLVPRTAYRSYRMLKWYLSIRQNATKNPYAKDKPEVPAEA